MELGKFKKILEEYGINEKDFYKKKKVLSKRFGKEAPERDVIWSFFNQLILRFAGDFHELKRIYYDMALFLHSEGRNHYDMAKESRKMELLDYKQEGITKVRWVASAGSRTCKKCESMDGKVYPIENALKEMPLPLKDCKNFMDNPKYGFCRCCWITVLE